MGFDHLLTYDHVLGAVHAGRTPPLTGPYTERDPFHDPFVMFAYFAGITERIGFITGILILHSVRQRWWHGKRPMWTSCPAADCASVWGLDGAPSSTRLLARTFAPGRRQEEQIGLLRQLFTEPVVDFSGRFDRIDRAALVPRPARSIPIWLGGSSEAAFDRAARLADGFIFHGGDIARSVERWKRVRDQVAALGRSVEDFGAEYVAHPSSIYHLKTELDVWREAGGSHLSVVTMGLGLDSVDRPSHVPRIDCRRPGLS